MSDIDALLHHRPKPNRPLRDNFTQQVIEVIATNATTHDSRNVIKEFYMRLLRLPKLALVAVALTGAGSISAGAYATYQWLVPEVNITHITQANDDNKREFTVSIKDCGVIVGGATVSDGIQHYEVAKGSNLTNDQVIKVLKNSCNFQQVLQMVQTRWHDPMPPLNPKPGTIFSIVMLGQGLQNVLNDPSIGTVAAIDGSNITINSTVYQEYDGPSVFYPGQKIPDMSTLTQYFPNGKLLSRTFPLAGSTEVVDNGQDVPMSQVKPGDTVFFLTESQHTVQSNGTWGPNQNTQVIRLIKTDIDPAYVQTAMGIGNPAIVGPIAQLQQCQGNGQYLCVGDGKTGYLQYKEVYAVPSQADVMPGQGFDDNNKYFRKDLDLTKSNAGDLFHEIEGRITKISGNTITFQSRGTVATFNLTLPYDAVTAFNKNHTQKVSVGDMVNVDYLQATNENHTVIKSGDVTSFALVLRQLSDGSLVQY